jgi:uncharacterized protein YndB with AHSA1/START domain
VTASIVESDDTIEHEIRIAAGPDIVFGYLTDPNLLLRWKGLKAELNPKPGGIYQVRMNDRDVMRGEYVEVTPYSRVVFTMGWEASSTLPPGKSTVEIDLIPEGNNTLLRLRHRGLPIAERDQHGQGWDHYLARLQGAAAGSEPGVDPWLQR